MTALENKHHTNTAILKVILVATSKNEESYHIWLKYWRWTSPLKASTDPMENSNPGGFCICILLLGTKTLSNLSLEV